MPIPIFGAERNWLKQLQQLDAALRDSFSKLKRDLSNQAESLGNMESRLTKQEKTKRQLKRDIAVLQKQMKGTTRQRTEKERNTNQKVFGKSSVKTTERSANHRTTETSRLTPLHVEILKRLMIIQMESGRRSVSMRDLASELYPQKAYATIKATLSEYNKRLHQEGFVEKMNRGRLYLSYSEKALQFADDQRLNHMKQLISKPWQSVR